MKGKPLQRTLLQFLFAASLVSGWGCTVGPDENSGPDKDRGGAIPVTIGQVVSDDLNPEAGDSTDWKSFAVPAPGFLTVQVFWDQSSDIKQAVITVHDKFGAQLESRVHQASIPNDELVVRVDQGYYFVKLQAEKGASIYSLKGNHAYGEDDNGGGDGGTIRPDFAGTFQLDGAATADAAPAGGGAAAAGGAAAPAGGGGAAAAAPAGGSLPVAAAGGAAAPAGGGALPAVAAGGSASVAETPVAPQGATAVPLSTVTKASVSSGKAKSEPKAATVAAEPAAKKFKPIVADIEGPYRELETSLRLITPVDDGSRLKLGSGDQNGVKVGQVGEIFVKGQLVSGARFKITKVLKNSCVAATNAPADAIKDADRIIIKIPEN